MTTYNVLVEQAKALMAQAEEVRKQELASVIADIKAKMKEHGITASDLGIAGGARKVRAAKAPGVVKYKNANGETWAGGLGRKPRWVADILAQGGDIEQYRV